ncbi:hypothetical protein IV203_000888 [Nitzschia inconspicua]|uniref:Uncharacterized protein n=1 Tax=Nitzschia inconspicua TaxID=303405 RepID=A0A9K3PQN7_9STRA|nr:hypothetical protein IV203_000888 [Nitzschia inconspicua]
MSDNTSLMADSYHTGPTTLDSKKEAPDADPAPRRLTCFFRTENAAGEIIPDLSNNSSDKVYLHQEPGKKSSFLLEPEESITPFYTVEKPPNVVIEYENPQAAVAKESMFFLGGFQMVSTAKTVEIYLTDMECKESYLTTSKGIPFNKEDKTTAWYKTICVVPGGPRPILRLRIKLLSLRPTEASTAKLQFMKLTARIAETPSPQPSAQRTECAISPASGAFAPFSSVTSSATPTSRNSCKPKNVFFSTPEPANPEPAAQVQSVPSALSNGVTQSDLGAAMAGVSFMARSTEKGIEEAMNEQINRLEKSFGSCFLRMEQQLHFLQRHLIVQQQLIQENLEVMETQKHMIEDQNNVLRDLVKQQDDLKIRVQSLQADMSIVRYQRFDSGNNMQNNSKRDLVEHLLAEPCEEKNECTIPPMMEIGTKVRDIDDGQEDDVMSGIVDNSIKESRDIRDVQMENINFKKLIQRTAREIEEHPVTCGPSLPESSAACGLPSFAQKSAGCVSLPDGQVLFQGMMLTDEELLYQRMSHLRASRDAEDTFEEPATDEEEPPEVEDENLVDTEDYEPEEDAHVNIEVTLLDDGDDERGKDECSDEEDYDAGYGGVFTAELQDEEICSQPLVEDLPLELEVGQTGSFDDGDATVAAKNSGFRTVDEKKEMEPMDRDIAKEMTVTQLEGSDLETQTCFGTQGSPCVPVSTRPLAR